MSHLKTPFVLIPIFLNVILLVGIPYFGAKPPMLSLFPLLALAMVWPWVMYFVIAGIIDYLAKHSERKRARSENGDFI